MKLSDLIAMYESKKILYGDKAYLHVSEIFEQAREKYKQEYLTSPKAQRLKEKGKAPDPEQSWKAFKGKNFEKLIWRVIDSELGSSLNLRCIPSGKLGRKKISPELGKVYRNLLVRYGQWSLLPDADLVIYEPSTCQVVGIISCKITLRERIAQTAYWKEVQSKGVEIVSGSEYPFYREKISEGGTYHRHGKANHNWESSVKDCLGQAGRMGTEESAGVHPVSSGGRNR